MNYETNLGDFYSLFKVICLTKENALNALTMDEADKIMLVDRDSNISWLVQSDKSGYKTVIPYKISPISADVKSIREDI